eukprot:13525430-Alexandrium_andersonii.AAC.1
MHEDGAKRDVLLVEPVVQEVGDTLLGLEGGSVAQLRATKHVAHDLPCEVAEDVVLDGAMGMRPAT